MNNIILVTAKRHISISPYKNTIVLNLQCSLF